MEGILLPDEDPQFSDGETLSDTEELEISVDFLKCKALPVLVELEGLIPKDMYDGDGRTLLHWAASSHQFNKVKFLLEHNVVDINKRDDYYKNALESAAHKSTEPIVDILSDYGLECLVSEPSERLNPTPDIYKEGVIVAAICADNASALSNHFGSYVMNINGLLCYPRHYEWSLLTLASNELAPNCMSFLLTSGCDTKIYNGWDGSRPLSSVLRQVVYSLPPFSEEEWVDLDNGVDCLMQLVGDWDDEYRTLEYTNLLRKLIHESTMLDVRVDRAWHKTVCQKVQDRVEEFRRVVGYEIN